LISGICRVRDEVDIIEETLDWYAEICDNGIVVFDDGSTDGTADVCEQHPAVDRVIGRQPWQRIIYTDQGDCRWEAAQRTRGDWIMCFDADERAELTEPIDYENDDAVFFRLFDSYMTPDGDSEWIGPEYRDIVMMWRRTAVDGIPAREPRLMPLSRQTFGGYCRHLGKARGVQRWERKCRLYQEEGYPASWHAKWKARMGKAIKHDYCSDFGLPLIKWGERFEKGVPLEDG